MKTLYAIVEAIFVVYTLLMLWVLWTTRDRPTIAFEPEFLVLLPGYIVLIVVLSLFDRKFKRRGKRRADE